MAKLLFKNAGLLPVIAHVLAAEKFTVGFGEAAQAYEKATGKEYNAEVDLKPYMDTDRQTMFFVKDDGIYLMAGNAFVEMPKDNSHFVYAEGFNPKKDKDVWEKCRNAVGGDDFGETIFPSKMMLANIQAGADVLITITLKQFTVATVMPARVKK